MSHNNNMENMENEQSKNEEEKPNAPCGLIVIGDRARMREAAKTNPTLAKLLENRTTRDEETMLTQLMVGGASPKDTRKTFEEWAVALKYEEGKGARGIHGEINIIVVGADDRSDPSPVSSPIKSEAAEPKERSSSRVYSHDVGRNLNDICRDFLNLFQPGRSCLQAMLDSGMPSMHLGNIDIKEVDTKGAENTAEILKRAIDMDTIPTDPLTREHFGFSKCNNTDDEVNLCGLYEGLLSYLAVTTKQLHEWQRDNKLAAGILEAYYPRESGYLSWFKEKKHLVDAEYVRPGGLKAPPGQGEPISKNHCDH